MAFLSKTEFVSRLQLALNKCLTLYLNAGMPGLPSITPEDLTNIINEAVRTKRWPATLGGIIKVLKVICEKNVNSKSHSIAKCSSLLAECYKVLERLISEQTDNTELRIVKIDKMVAPSVYGNDYAYLRPVFEFASYARKSLEPWTCAVLLHGSLATLDYVKDYSDFDTLMVIKNQTLSNSLELEQFRKTFRRSLGYLYWFDPLQHHGHIILTECDLNWYPERILPIAVFENARSLTGKQFEISFLVRDSTHECLSELIRVVEVFEERAMESWVPEDPWTTKSFLSELMLLPSIYCQALGHHCYKKDSFKIAKETMHQNTWSVVNEATEIRKCWHYNRANNLLSGFAVHLGLNPWIAKKLSTNRRSRVLSQLPRRIDKTFVQAVANLAACMLQQLETKFKD